MGRPCLSRFEHPKHLRSRGQRDVVSYLTQKQQIKSYMMAVRKERIAKKNGIDPIVFTFVPIQYSTDRLWVCSINCVKKGKSIYLPYKNKLE